MKAASEKTGLPIDSVMNMDHWEYPFSSADPAVVEKSLDGARVSIRTRICGELRRCFLCLRW